MLSLFVIVQGVAAVLANFWYVLFFFLSRKLQVLLAKKKHKLDFCLKTLLEPEHLDV